MGFEGLAYNLEELAKIGQRCVDKVIYGRPA